MDSTYRRVSTLENFFSQLLTGYGISKHIFFTNLPATIGKDWQDMVLVDVVKVQDYDAYATASVNVFLYARGRGASLMKPVYELDKLESNLDDAVDVKTKNTRYSLVTEWADNGFNSQIGFYYIVRNISVTIKRFV